nr:reticuline oxidase-like protein [Ipomoea batatas]
MMTMNSNTKLFLFSCFLVFQPLCSVSYAGTDPIYDEFVGCLSTAGDNAISKDTVSKIVYNQVNPKFTSVLDAYIRNGLFNTSETRKPTIIVTPTEESHVPAVVLCAEKAKIQIKIRSGGHDYEGLSYVSSVPFIVLDMFNLKSIEIDVAGETAWVQAGATLGELYYRISEKSPVHGFPAGVCPTIGVGGHITGGGYGNMIHKYGLSSDHVLDARIVDVKGRILDGKAMGDDLFWAIKGGGGASFGVILAYKIKLVLVPPKVTYFSLQFKGEEAMDVFSKYQEVASIIDNNLFIRATLKGGKNSSATEMNAIAQFLGDSKTLISITDEHFPVLGLKQENCIEMTWIQSILQWYGFPYTTTNPDFLLNRNPNSAVFFKRKSDYLHKPIPKQGLESLFKKIAELGSSELTLNPYGGKMGEITAGETPFPHRAGTLFKIQYAETWMKEEAGDKYANNLRELHSLMTPYVSSEPREAFLNYRDIELGTNDNGPRRYEEAKVYGHMYFKNNFDRLVKVKTAVDPDNFFWNEQSIPPLSAAQ